MRESEAEEDLSQTSEFLLVAATLLDLKAARLLPTASVEDDEDIRIEYPDAIQAMDYERAQTAYEQLQVLTKADFPRILDLVRGKPISVVQLLLTEMWAHWGDDSSEAPGGKEL